MITEYTLRLLTKAVYEANEGDAITRLRFTNRDEMLSAITYLDTIKDSNIIGYSIEKRQVEGADTSNIPVNCWTCKYVDMNADITRCGTCFRYSEWDMKEE